MTIEEWAKDFKSYVNELDMPRDDYKGIMEYIDDALTLLKEQEPKKAGNCNGELFCMECGNKIKSYYRFCDYCGRAVKWE